MKEIDVTLEFITPAFIGAAENQRVSEFRLSSLKGLLRFWWRAHQNFLQEEELFQHESQIFGDTTRKSAFSISLEQPLQSLIRNSLRQSFQTNQPGIRYLFYSMYQMGKKSPGRTNWLEPGTTVNIRFRFFDEGSIKQVIAALWWLENFGGIGTRSRRGAGSFRITKITPLQGTERIPQFMCQGWTPKTQTLKEEISAFLKTGIESSCHPITSKIPSYTAFRNGVSNYKVLAGYTSWTEATNAIGTKLSGFPKPSRPSRSARFQNESRAIHTFGSNGSYPPEGPNPLTRAAFGLPIQYYFRDRTKVRASGSVHSRRSSPVFIKIGYLPNGHQYYVVILSLWAKFLLDNEKITLEALNAKSHSLNQPDRSVIENFLKSL